MFIPPVPPVVSGGLELRLETPKREEASNGSVMEQQQQPGGTKLYDADDEEGESSEVILSRGSGAITEAAVTATTLLPHQDLVFKRKRPSSLTRYGILSSEQRNDSVLLPGFQILQQRRRMRRSGRQSEDLVREAASSPKLRR